MIADSANGTPHSAIAESDHLAGDALGGARPPEQIRSDWLSIMTPEMVCPGQLSAASP
jgi:hypothetical protein